MNKPKTDAEIDKLLREGIRRRATNELFEAMDRMAAVEGAPPQRHLAITEDMAGVTAFRYHRSTSHRAIIMTTLEIRLSLPDKVANDAKAAGLLTAEAIETLIAEALRRKAFDEILSNADRVEAAGIPPMSMEEIDAEIEAYRAERRRAEYAPL